MYYTLIISLLLLFSIPSFSNYEFGVVEESNLIQTTLQNNVEDDYSIRKEATHSSSERMKKIITSTVVTFVIILVALTPKLLLIYITMKKSKNVKPSDYNHVTINHEINPDLHFEELRRLVIKMIRYLSIALEKHIQI